MISLNEALNNYYEFKTLYETSYDKEKRDIINNKKISWNEKRSRFQKLKPKCINCKRPVGTIFSRKFTDDKYGGFKNLLAVCGDKVNPCKLNINIKLDIVNSLENNIKELDDRIKEDKNFIIQKKNELLFGYTTTEKAINTFEQYKTELNETYDLKNFFLELLINKTDNEDKKKELKELLSEYYVIIKNINKDIIDANVEGNIQLIEDTIRNNYVDLLISKPGTSDTQPQIGKLEKIRNLKYMYNTVEYNEDTNKYHLIQKKNTIESLEEPHSSELISYVFGVFESKGKTKKKDIKKKKSTTRKLTIEEDSPSEEKAQEGININIPSKLPIIGPDGKITWEDDNYKKAWNYLSSKHKELLSKDAVWLQESMNQYAKNTEEKKTLKFVYPINVIFPPRKLQDGSFDFGNEFYNEVININKGLITDYLNDSSRVGKPNLDASGKPNGRPPINQKQVDTWFKGRLEEKVYDYLYPVRSQLIVR
jgi:hypothetical protein